MKGVIFDLWNTLAYNRGKENPVAQLEKEFGIDFNVYLNGEREVEIREFKTWKDAARILCKVLDVRPTDRCVEKAVEIWSGMISKFTLFPDVKRTLAKLRGEGYKVGLISNTDCFSTKPLFDKHINRHFDAMAFSYEVGVLKPDKKIFGVLLKRLGLKASDTLMVGDNLKDDIMGGEKMGMKCILIKRKGRYSLSWVEKGTYKNEISSLDGIWGYFG